MGGGGRGTMNPPPGKYFNFADWSHDGYDKAWNPQRRTIDPTVYMILPSGSESRFCEQTLKFFKFSPIKPANFQIFFNKNQSSFNFLKKNQNFLHDLRAKKCCFRYAPGNQVTSIGASGCCPRRENPGTTPSFIPF